MSARLRRHQVAAVFASMVIPLAAIGCSDSGQAVGGTGGCNSPGVTPTTIKVGLIYPDSGPIAATLGPTRAGVEARVRLANASGGVNGRQIELTWKDDGGDARTFENAAGELVTGEGVFGLIAETLNITNVADRLDQQGIPITGLPAEAAWTQHRNMFTLAVLPTPTSPITTFGVFAHQLGATRAVVVTDPSSPSVVQLSQSYAVSLRSQGIEVVDTIPFTAGVTNPVSVAAKIRAARADALFGPLTPDDFVAVYDEAKKAGVTIKVALNGSGDGREMLAKYGTAATGISLMANHTPFSVESAAMDNYRRAMVAFAPESSEVENDITLVGYVTADEFIRGLELAGDCPTRQSFITNLRAEKNYNAGGLIPDIDLSRYSEPTLCYIFVRVNEAGTAFEVVPNTGAPDPTQWCGTRQN